MCPKSIILFLFIYISSALAQISPAFFGAGFADFSSHFSNFGPIGSSSFPSEGGGGGRSNTGPILFPPAPESRDTSGVIVGASGYGFVPPGGGGRDIVPPRDFQSSSLSGTFGSPFGQNFFHL